MEFHRLIPQRFMLLLLISISAHVSAQDSRLSYYWQPYDETGELRQQAEHATPRMRFKLINSKLLDKNSLWSAFTEELADFSVERYQALKPLILEQSIPALQRAVAGGQLSYEELVKFYLYRIRLFESDNSRALNALIATNPEAIAQARSKDRARANGGLQVDEYSLFGIPILLKDNIGTQGMATTAGAVALQSNNTGDAFITRRLKANGAIILGKANLSEWAYFFCDGCPLGYSAIGGQTLNPYGRRLIESGGSSSGSAVAVAANYAAAAVGSETSGSILSPASLNSTVGLKPTTGMLSRTGVVPISSTLDTTGPIAKNLTDAMILFNAMTGYDKQDSAMPMLSVDAGLSLNNNLPQGLRLGYFVSLEDNALYKGALDLLRQAGADLIEIPQPELELQNFGEFLGAEMKKDLPVYLSSHAGDAVNVSTIAEVLAFNGADPLLRAPYGQGRFEAMAVSNFNETEINDLRDRLRATGLQALGTPLSEFNLDALLSINNFHAGLAASANFPALTVPMGYEDNGQPAGLTFIGASYSEQELVGMGLLFEQLHKVRLIPADYQ